MDPNPTPPATPAPDRGNAPENGEDGLFPVVYAELHRLAERLLSRERPGHTLQPTALVHEVYVKLAEAPTRGWQGKTHYYRVASQAMRRVLVDHARGRQRLKRGGELPKMSLDEGEVSTDARSLDLVILDDALQSLASFDPELARIVELRFFGGLRHPEIAELLGMSLRSVERSWALARAWLNRELRPEAD